MTPVQQENPEEASGTRLPIKCLLVDDRPENLLSLSAVLKSRDVEVLTALSGRQALELLLLHDVALALLDVQMPEMDGFELAELLRGSERTRHIPLIFVTAGGNDQHRLFKGYESGAVDFLFKPIEPRILKSKADVFFDLYRTKQLLAQELNEKTETLRLNETFAAILGHDLRGPLSAIQMSAMTLQRKAQEPSIRERASLILASSKWMGRMISEILDLSRARLMGGIPIAIKEANLADLLARVVDEQKIIHPDIILQVRTEGDLKGAWDPDRLMQVMSNLIGNAVQHGDASGVQIDLVGTEVDEVILSVANQGAINPDLMPHVFEPFRGRTPASGVKEGLGLGLFIVHEIVSSHHGKVVVETRNDTETVFTVRLPRHVFIESAMVP